MLGKIKRIDKKSILLALALIAVSIVIAASAAKVYEYSFKNNIVTGSVDIDLQQLSINSEGKLVEATGETILPGQQISYIPMVENLRNDAYVRVKVDIAMEEDTDEPITVDNIYQNGTKSITADETFQTTDSESWIRKGDYFYNTKPMKNGEKSFAFQGISVPENWVSDIETSLPASGDKPPAQASSFSVLLHADAIQAKNFSPDFDSDMPWGSIVTEQAKDSDSSDYGIAKPLVVHNELTFSKGAGLEANTKDLFRNFQLYMADDTYKDKLTIKNTSSNGITVYFKTKSKETDLNKKMGLDITMKGKNIYSGNLASQKLDSYKKLVHLAPGEKVNLNYEVTLPDDSKNYYSVLADDTTWLFSVTEDKKSPKTGDRIQLAIWFAVMALGFMLLAMLINFARKRDNTL